MDVVLSDREAATFRGLAAAFVPDGYGIPGGGDADVPARFQDRARSWDPAVWARVRWLLRAWDATPLLSRHARRFSSLDLTDQIEWVEHCYRSRSAAHRQLAAGLKQLVLLTWASTPVVEEALGFDYRCRKDDAQHGSGRPSTAATNSSSPGPEPPDYHRPGIAVASGAIPIHLFDRKTFEHRAEHDHKLTTRAWPDVQPGEVLRCDVVVIGSGAGGSVTAAALAESGASVIVVEEGPQADPETDFVGPVFDRFQRYCRDNATTQVWGTPPIPLPLGKVVGGTTVVNSGTCFRTPDRVLDRWSSEHGVAGATRQEMAPYFDEVEDFLNVRPVPWAVLGGNGAAAHKGAVALGLTGGPLLRNIADCHGCGQCAFGCPTNAKQAMHVSYLPRAQRAGADILARCRVDRIVHDGHRARGVELSLLDSKGRPQGNARIDAQSVVVAAGAIHTPGLLSGSGIPDMSGQTGRNLRIHPATGVGGFFEDEDLVAWKGTLQSYYIDAMFESHEVMFEATSTIPSVGAGSLPGLGPRLIADLTDMRKMATLGFYVSDTTRGRVRRMPNGEQAAFYRINACDTRRVVAALALASEVLLAAGAKRVYPGIPGVESISSPRELDALRERAVKPGHLKLTAFHPMGTARMGGSASSAVVDSYGRHYGMENLYVTDASVFPTCVGVNPQITIMAFARRSAERMASAT